ncbi:carbohydrate binding domain-containing protein, partial [candidate division KSB1 bacterium]|nr:carbohydrate binding domain-containing protein [candidate division KSB1 bacterium]
MVKYLKLLTLLTVWLFSSLYAQDVILSDEFDDGDGQWAGGWIDASTAVVTVSIDTNSVLSGKNSYLLDVTTGGPDTWRIQRNANCPLLAGKMYTVSFEAVADKDMTINIMMEIVGDPYTKRLVEWPEVTTTPQTFTYTLIATEDVSNNQFKMFFGGPDNNNYKIWVDNIVVTEEDDLGPVSQWGLVQEYKSLWPILNDATTPAGNGSMGGDVVSGWKGLQGGFSQDLTISAENAVVVTGQVEFVGANAGTAYTPIRYAITYQDSSDLLYAATDSAQWSRSGHHSGYGFHPRTGAGTMSNGNGGAGTVWTISDGNWASTWSNNGGPASAALQAPRNAELIEGTYNFAISVHAIDDTTNEVRWYMIEENNKYWFGGVTKAAATTKTFNSVEFGVNEVEYTQFNVVGMRAELGAPIDVPEAPWQSYYVDQWGLAKEYSSLWPMLNDSTTLVGDGSMGGDVVSGWKGLQGGLGQPVEFSTEKAVIVEGQIEFVGANAGTAYTPIRYAFTYQDSSSLMYQYTDSAQWSGTGHHYGYGFHPRTGAGTMSNGNGGAGTVWTINNGNWASTWSNNGGPVSAALQAPRNAELIEGTYDFAISVH